MEFTTDDEKKEIEEIEKIKKVALKKIKKEYEEFYIAYAAVEPSRVRGIQQFLDWLKTATEDDIQVKKVNCLIRRGKINVSAVFENKLYRYTELAHTLNVRITNDRFYADYTGAHYSSEVNSKVVPGNIQSIAEREHVVCEQNPGATCTFVKANAEYSHFDDPTSDSYYHCYMSFPYNDEYTLKSETAIFRFVLWNGSLRLKDKENPGEMLTKNKPTPSPKPTSKKSGCFVATAVYGSYDCPQVWTLRRYRDNTLGSTWYGRAFIRLYYAVSPTLVKWFGKKNWFIKMWRKKLDEMVSKLNKNGIEDTPYQDIDWKK